jgi:hypothetical protein
METSSKLGKILRQSAEEKSELKHQLILSQKLKEIKVQEFVRTEAYHRCFTVPNTNEYTMTEAILHEMIPIVNGVLVNRRVEEENGGFPKWSFAFVPGEKGGLNAVAVNVIVVFCEIGKYGFGRSLNRSTMSKTIGCLLNVFKENGLDVLPGHAHPPRGFKMAPICSVAGRSRYGSAGTGGRQFRKNTGSPWRTKESRGKWPRWKR